MILSEGIAMTVAQQKKTLEKIASLEAGIEQLKAARMKLLSDGIASATFSFGSGSKSYTKQDAAKLTAAIAQMTAELKALRALLNGVNPAMPTSVYTVYC